VLADAITDAAKSNSRATQPEFARAVVRGAARRYALSRRDRVDAFIDRHFTFAGSLALHRCSLGWDLVRAPLNLFLTVPALAAKIASRAARRAGRLQLAMWLARNRLLFETDLAREIEWLVATELLEIPCCQRDRASFRDALAEAVLADPRVAERLGAPLTEPAGSEREFRGRLVTAIESYIASRMATAEITTGVVATGFGALAVKQATPGLVTLGSALAAAIAQQNAIAAFPLGAGLGGLWYGWFPAVAGPGLIAATTGGVVIVGAVLAAFSGVLTDPLKLCLGLHRRRLLRLLEELERALCDEGNESVTLRDHYVARLIDLLDLVASAWRLSRG
jgi:hypothetical protein